MGTVDEILEDSPIFFRLSKPDLILTTAVIALSMTEHDEAFNILPELPGELDEAISLMDVHQKQEMMCWISQRIVEQR